MNFILNGVLLELLIEKRTLNQRYNVVSQSLNKVHLKSDIETFQYCVTD